MLYIRTTGEDVRGLHERACGHNLFYKGRFGIVNTSSTWGWYAGRGGTDNREGFCGLLLWWESGPCGVWKRGVTLTFRGCVILDAKRTTHRLSKDRSFSRKILPQDTTTTPCGYFRSPEFVRPAVRPPLRWSPLACGHVFNHNSRAERMMALEPGLDGNCPRRAVGCWPSCLTAQQHLRARV